MSRFYIVFSSVHIQCIRYINYIQYILIMQYIDTIASVAILPQIFPSLAWDVMDSDSDDISQI